MPIIFEPWALGDSVIAASVFRHLGPGEKKNWKIACKEIWWPTLTYLYDLQEENFLPLELPWAGREKRYTLRGQLTYDTREKLYSIRGDFRDYFAARKIFPRAELHYHGFFNYLCSRIRLLDYATFWWQPPQNRYHDWQRLIFGEPKPSLPPPPRAARRIAMHIGASSLARRYPYFRELAVALQKEGIRLEFFASGEKDLKQTDPTGITMSKGQEMIEALRTFDLVICNDSGPLHVCAAAGLLTVGLFEVSNPRVWCPPNAYAINHHPTPHLKQIDYRAFQDIVLKSWLTPEQIIDQLRTLQLL